MVEIIRKVNMKKVIFECESITPILMHGADGKTAELRPTSIKGVMRFWWRAINGNLSLDKLKRQEGEIFGSTEKRSKLIIFPIEITETKNYPISPTPHHEEGYCSDTDSSKGCYFKKDNKAKDNKAKDNECMKANQKVGKLYTFRIKMALKFNEYLNEEQLKNLFIIATTLGGFGQRSRRGFGSIQITQINDTEFIPLQTEEEIKAKIFEINSNFKYKSDVQYPYIKDIHIDNNLSEEEYIDLLEKIGKTTHKFNDNMFGSIKPRYASPIYISVINSNNYTPIFTTLHNTKKIDSVKLDDFKRLSYE